MHPQVKNLLTAVRLIGPFATARLLLAKEKKRRDYAKMLNRHRVGNRQMASLREVHPTDRIPPDESRETIAHVADSMLGGRGIYFTFPYSLHVNDPWSYDPLEGKHWPRRHYTEQYLHATDTPKDVKIVWEINRFKDLPTLAQAATISGKREYIDELLHRIESWIRDNPFAATINWASGLELAIRSIAWTASIVLLKRYKLIDELPDSVRQSIWEHATYLRHDLSLDKVVRTNHLIGEATGLFVLASIWQFPEAEEYRNLARATLENEIIAQTYSDGATREASTWYHQFVTDFLSLASRVAEESSSPFSSRFRERLSKMCGFREATLDPAGAVARLGDADDGYALYFTGDRAEWTALTFGGHLAEHRSPGEFESSKYYACRLDDAWMIVRGGEFGMGGDGFASHAHEDLLSPIVWLGAIPILCDPGTYVYNGEPELRARYRAWQAHNSVAFGGVSSAVQRLNFGWSKVRKPARLSAQTRTPSSHTYRGSYCEWPFHERDMSIGVDCFTIEDKVSSTELSPEWRLHLHPTWHEVDAGPHILRFVDLEGNRLLVTLEGNFTSIVSETYDFSPSYRVHEPAREIRLLANPGAGHYRITITLSRHQAVNEAHRAPR